MLRMTNVNWLVVDASERVVVVPIEEQCCSHIRRWVASWLISSALIECVDVSSGAKNRLLKDTSTVTDDRRELLAGDPENFVQSRVIFEVGSRKIEDEHLTGGEVIFYEVPLDVIAGIRSWFSNVSRGETVRSEDLRFGGFFAGLEMRISLEEPRTGGHRGGPDRSYDARLGLCETSWRWRMVLKGLEEFSKGLTAVRLGLENNGHCGVWNTDSYSLKASSVTFSMVSGSSIVTASSTFPSERSLSLLVSS